MNDSAGRLIAALVFIIIGLCLAYLALDVVIRAIRAIWREAEERDQLRLDRKAGKTIEKKEKIDSWWPAFWICSVGFVVVAVMLNHI